MTDITYKEYKQARANTEVPIFTREWFAQRYVVKKVPIPEEVDLPEGRLEEVSKYWEAGQELSKRLWSEDQKTYEKYSIKYNEEYEKKTVEEKMQEYGVLYGYIDKVDLTKKTAVNIVR